MRHARGLRRSTAGQALLEFAFVVPLVAFLMFGIFEFGRHFYTRLTLQHAVAETARFAVTGRVLSDSLGDPISRAEFIVEVIRARAASLAVDVDRVTIDPPDGGGPGEVVTATAAFSFRFVAPGYKHMFPGGVLDFSVSSTMKNEPLLRGAGS